MKYLLLFCANQEALAAWQALSEEDRIQSRAKTRQWMQEHGSQVRWIYGLHLPHTVTSVHTNSNGQLLVTDGPFLEGTEVIGGVAEIEVADLDEALQFAKAWAVAHAPDYPVIEIWPLVEKEDPISSKKYHVEASAIGAEQKGHIMGQPVVHFEIIGKDPEKLRRYYGDLFGWAFDRRAPVSEAVSELGNYGSVDRNTTSDGVGIPGGIGGGRGYEEHVIFYIGVPDVEAALQRAESLGGTRRMGPKKNPEAPLPWITSRTQRAI